MDKYHLLQLGNPQTVMKCLESVVDHVQLQAIQAEVERNTRQLLRLADTHYRFAARATGQDSWRQTVSRGYYACYIASRAVRLAVHGKYNTDPSDHKKIADLPSDFPQSDQWEDFLTKFRADRNMADYDHTRCRPSLALDPGEYLMGARDFINATKHYLNGRGHI